MNATLMTQAEYAAHRGVKPPAVSNWKKAGYLVLAEDPARPNKLFVDRDRTDARVNANVNSMRGRPSTAVPAASTPIDAGAETLDAARPQESSASVRIDLAREQIHGMRIKNAQAAGDLVPAIELTRRAAELGRVCRERVHAALRTLAERLAAERDHRVIAGILAAETDRVFAELADQVEGGMLAPEDEPDEPAVVNEIEAAAAEVA